MFDYETLCKQSGADLRKIEKVDSEYEIKIKMANQAVAKWLSVPRNKEYLRNKKHDYSLSKGWIHGKTMKEELTIPMEAAILLPREVRNDNKEMLKWVEKYHPYLFFRNL